MRVVLMACAVQAEQDGIRLVLSDRGYKRSASATTPAGYDLWSKLGANVVVAQTGQTNTAAQSGIQQILKNLANIDLFVETVVFVGTCGGINSKVKVGDVVVPKKILHIRSYKEGAVLAGSDLTSFECSSDFTGWATEHVWKDFELATGTVVAQDSLLSDMQNPRLLAIKNMDGNAVAIEMESGGFLEGLKTAAFSGRAFVTRGVMDTIGDREDTTKIANRNLASRNAALVAITLLEHEFTQSSGSSTSKPSQPFGTIKRKAKQFSNKWEGATSESADRQTFWNDFFDIFGIKREQVANFEKSAIRESTGGTGKIDLLYAGRMGVEHKSAGEDLEKAMAQLKDYRLPESERPPLLITCNFKNFGWSHAKTGESGLFRLADLDENLQLFSWIAGYDAPWEDLGGEVDVNLDATALLATIHDELKEAKFPEHERRVLLTRLLFCFFADDTEIWDRAAFASWLPAATSEDGKNLGVHLMDLFRILNTPFSDRSPNLASELKPFPYINGGLFAEKIQAPDCNARIRDAIIRAGHFNWANISPVIFGSMFQNVMTSKERRKLGAHYTTEENILKTIEPLFLTELRSELESASTRPAIEKLHDKLAGLRFLDPACGCGNFLVVAYREIRTRWHQNPKEFGKTKVNES
jgi:purine-nucleoside phosphorylase